MKKKIFGLVILLFSYIIATILGILFFKLFENKINLLLNIFICNCIATVFIWIIGIIFKSASIYDPYWSIQTPVIYILLLIYFNNYNIGNVIFFVLISFWAIRLTYNFIHGFNDISYIDWRYKMIKEKTGKLYQIVSLLGIHMVPTIIVYVASIPAFMYIIKGNQFSFLNIVGYIIIIIGVLLELIADINMIKFKKLRTRKDEIINIGLWKYSRHPNYLGEITFWYGVAFVFILSNLKMWYLIIGSILNTLLFIFISIPLAENHLKTYKVGYDEYKNKTNKLLPFRK